MELQIGSWKPKRVFLYAAVGLFSTLIVSAIVIPNLLRSRIAADQAAAVGGQRMLMAKLSLPEQIQSDETRSPDARKIVRKSTYQLVVQDPRQTIEQILEIVERHHGYVISSELSGGAEKRSGTIALRVPIPEITAFRSELKALAKSVDAEQVSAEDVTMQYADNEANLRNFRAEEASYLEIMKRSGKISDTLEVAGELANVRGRIERLQSQMRVMEHETAMASIAVELRTEPIVQKTSWRPLYELQAAWHEGGKALAQYATAMMSVVAYVPAIIAWILTLALGGKLVILVLKGGAVLFGLSKSAGTKPAQ